MKVKIKPLSVNQAWQGRRFRTDKYKAYTSELLLKLKPLEVPTGDLELTIQVGFSNKASDLDNILKPFIDILQKKYGFNDSQIYCLTVLKKIVPKGEEYISFDLFECFKENEIATALTEEIIK